MGYWRKRKPFCNRTDRGSCNPTDCHLPHAQAGRLPYRCLVTRKYGKPSQERRQMAGMDSVVRPISPFISLPGALFHIAVDWLGESHHPQYAMAPYVYRKVCTATCKRVWQQAFERLEPCAVKVASTVLRRGGGGNASFLSGHLICERGAFCQKNL